MSVQVTDLPTCTNPIAGSLKLAQDARRDCRGDSVVPLLSATSSNNVSAVVIRYATTCDWTPMSSKSRLLLPDRINVGSNSMARLGIVILFTAAFACTLRSRVHHVGQKNKKTKERVRSGGGRSRAWWRTAGR